MLQQSQRSSIFCLVILLLCTALPAAAGAAPHWSFTSVPDVIPASDFSDKFVSRQFSVATAINNHGNLIGYWLDDAGQFHGLNILFGTNPEYLIWDTPDFIDLAAGEGTCVWVICNVVTPYGIRINEGVAASAWLTTPLGTSVVPGSLPFSSFPGNFVESNANRVVASTQVSDTSRFVAIIDANGVVPEEDLSWAVAINDLAEPLILAVSGDASCDVYGCEAPDEDCQEEGDGHSHTRGRGHMEHGQGHGYGHDACHQMATDDGSAEGATASSSARALLLRFMADRSVQRYGFADHLGTDVGGDAVSALFPLALNDSRIIVRADVLHAGSLYHQQLLRCDVDASALDANLDGVVDCEGGLQPLLPLDDDLRMATVLGYTLNRSGILIGNLGYSASGTGTPFVIDTTATTPSLQLLVNRLDGASNWELNSISDVNDGATAIGYGYRNCSSEPDMFFLTLNADSATDLGFDYSNINFDTLLVPGSQRHIDPQVSGGSGSYMFSYAIYDPSTDNWLDQQGWTSAGFTLDAGTVERDICVRIRVADTANPDDMREQVVRFTVSNSAAATGSPLAQPAVTNLGNAIAETLPTIGCMPLFSLLCSAGLLVWRRRQVR